MIASFYLREDLERLFNRKVPKCFFKNIWKYTDVRGQRKTVNFNISFYISTLQWKMPVCGWKANTTYYFITDDLFLAGFAPLLCAWPSAVTPPPWGLSKLGTADLFLLFWYQFLKVHNHLSVWFFLVFFFFPLFSGITSSASLKVGVDQKSNPISLFHSTHSSWKLTFNPKLPVPQGPSHHWCSSPE